SGTFECVLNIATLLPTSRFLKIILNSEHCSLMRVVIPIDFDCGKVVIDMWRIRLRFGLFPALKPSSAKWVWAPSSHVKSSGQSSRYVLNSGVSSIVLLMLVQYICILYSPYSLICIVTIYYSSIDTDSQLSGLILSFTI